MATSTWAARARRNLYFHSLLLAVTVGPLLFGYHLAELNAPSDVITCNKKSIRAQSSIPQCIAMTPLEFGLVQSIFTLGGLLGALVAGPISSSRGRLLTMQLNTIPTSLGPFVATFAPSVALFSVGRFLSGVGAGASLVVVPIYIAEIAPPSSRGFYGSFTQIMTNVGIFITQLIGYWLSHDAMWRVILGVAGCIGLAQAVVLCFAVESPKYLAGKGRNKDARTALIRIRGTPDVDEEMKGWVHRGDDTGASETEGLLGHDRATEEADLTFLQVVTDRKYRRAVLAILLVMASQQLTGINSIVMYGVKVLSKLLSSSSALLNIFVSILNIVATTAFAPVTDSKLGRKGCLLLSITGMGISSVLLGIGIRAEIKVLSAICVLTFVASFALGLGPVPFMLASELVDTKGVSATQSWALAGNWIATFLVAQFFPIVNDRVGAGVPYFGFAALGVVFVLLVGWYVPETRQKRNMAEVWGLGDEANGHDD